MLQEENFIPYTPSDLPPGPYLVFAPHPDDETFGMGGTIALAGQAGIAVHVVVLTDGQQAGDLEKVTGRVRYKIFLLQHKYFLTFF